MGCSYRNFDKDLFRARLNDHNWEHLHDIVSPERKWAYFHQIVENILNQMCPIKEFRINKLKEPWITPQLLELIKDKYFKLKKAKKSKKDDDFRKARRLRNCCTLRLRQAKAEFIKEQMRANGKDQKKFWKSINDIIPNSKNNKNLINSINENTNEDVPTDQTADFINQYLVLAPC